MFALKTCRLGDRITVAHLPRKISRSTKYLIARGAKVTGKLSSTNYREFPLLQGGLETPCVVTITLPASIKGHMLIQRYKNWLKNYTVNLKKRLYWAVSLRKTYRLLILTFAYRNQRKRKKVKRLLWKNQKGAKTFANCS